MPLRSGLRFSKAARPAGSILPSAVSRSTWAMLTALQMLEDLRGVHRWRRLSSSMRWETLSIQPKHSASGTASSHVRPRSATCFLRSPIHSSVALSWLSSSQARNSAASRKKSAGRSAEPPGTPIWVMR